MKRLLAVIAGSLALSACAGVPSPTPGVASEPVSATAPALAACGDETPPPDAPVYAFFSCADLPGGADPRPVPRVAHAADPVTRLESAVIGLLGGPNEAEREAGYFSFFSEVTALALNEVSIEPDGTAVVDLGDIRGLIPNASSSAGSELLLAQLNATAFQVAEVTGVEYRIDGSCEAFWEWLQRSCEIVPRP